MILIVIAMSFLATLAILGICYLFYEAIMDSKKPAEKIEEIPQSNNLRFKKPKL
jgi:threonine/homoserine/homoserine lactone efflux protein